MTTELLPLGYFDAYTYVIGSDESLKGDTFGGLAIAGVGCSIKQAEALLSMGVRDSKKLAVHQQVALANRIKEIVSSYAVRLIPPEEYNMYSLTGLLNKYHQLCYEHVHKQLGTPPSLYIVDKFPGCTVGELAIEKGERHISVAAASILARQVALEHMAELSRKIGWELPLGSTHVEEALYRLLREGHNPLQFVKVHFANVRRVMSEVRQKTM